MCMPGAVIVEAGEENKLMLGSDFYKFFCATICTTGIQDLLRRAPDPDQGASGLRAVCFQNQESEMFTHSQAVSKLLHYYSLPWSLNIPSILTYHSPEPTATN